MWSYVAKNISPRTKCTWCCWETCREREKKKEIFKAYIFSFVFIYCFDIYLENEAIAGPLKFIEFSRSAKWADKGYFVKGCGGGPAIGLTQFCWGLVVVCGGLVNGWSIGDSRKR